MMYQSVLKRFARAFAFGGIANMAAIVAVTKDVSNVSDWDTWFFSLVVAFVTGGIMALDKLVRYEE